MTGGLINFECAQLISDKTVLTGTTTFASGIPVPSGSLMVNGTLNTPSLFVGGGWPSCPGFFVE